MKKDKALVSFILTCYNIPTPMLCECINSILALSLRPSEREIIIVDDGSDVSPMNDLLTFGNDITYIRQKNGGLSVARNLGIKMATGEYIQFVDGDDKLLQAPYEHCLDIIRYNSHPDMVMFDFTRKEAVKTSVEEALMTSGAEYMNHHNIQASACGYVFRKSILGELRFTPGIYHEDEEFTPQLLLRTDKLYISRAKAYFYRLRTDSIMTNSKPDSKLKRLSDKKDIILRLYEKLDTLPLYERNAMQRRIAQLSMDYIYNVICQTRNREYLESQLEALRQEGLFPLPDGHYTAKYTWFRRMTNSKYGLSLLIRVLPRLRPER